MTVNAFQAFVCRATDGRRAIHRAEIGACTIDAGTGARSVDAYPQITDATSSTGGSLSSITTISTDRRVSGITGLASVD